ncbi:sulfite exporter TauE/SafE family protein [Robiginitalea sp. SC105]|uniref:sulfite exporter TauE/SafE family protein n=1 Tax=Robiginitalea sp. SC105 TaxID=2762332 RepID=UPI00163A6E60|nr:sulfite exporter TauE/SafE family protein [Robiginitalea sp. SC105]MBC2838652.1 sulfite exporter TauE/SafE family protein [Robiginitalea sp. SC105]
MLATAFLLGLMGSLHCIGMCGPIAFMLPLDRQSGIKKYGQLSLYHMGRLLAYAMIGGLFGLVGRGLYLFGFQQKLSIFIGALMILAVLVPWSRFGGRGLAGPLYRLIGKLKSALGAQLQKRTADTFLTIGFLNGFLPCGLVYMAVIGSMAPGTALGGATFMMLFGLGTVPLMSVAALFGKYLKSQWARRLRRAIPVLVVLIGVLFILRGMGLGIPYISPLVPANPVASGIECHP